MTNEKLDRIREKTKKWAPLAASAICGGIVVAVGYSLKANLRPTNYILTPECMNELMTNPNGFIAFNGSKNIVSTRYL